MNSNKPAHSQRSRKGLWIFVILLLVIAGVGGVFALNRTEDMTVSSVKHATFTVQRGPLTISVIESGTIRSREQEIVKSEVEGRATLIWIIPEGTQVKKGDLLAELDSSLLQDNQTELQIQVQNTEAAFITSKETLEVVKNQAQSDVSKAELDLRFAKMNLDKYLKGEFPQELQQAEAEITLAREDLQRATEKLTWSKRLAEENYITRTELQADELAANKCALELQLAEGRLTLLKEFTHKQKVAELESAQEQAEMALERISRKANADVVQAQADLQAKQLEFDRQKSKLDKNQNQIKACKIYSPRDGMVVYSTTGQGGWHGNDEPLKEGVDIRERQELIYLPTASAVMVQVKLHESYLGKVQVGSPVRVTADVLPGRQFAGSVSKIGLLPDAGSYWMNPDLKVYDTEIHLDGDGSELRTGMSCYAEIVIEEYPEATYVPVQCVVRVNRQPTAYVLKGGIAVPRPVEIGLDNNRMVHVISGLEPGEEVLMSPPFTPDTKEIRDATPGQPEAREPVVDASKKRPEESGSSWVRGDESGDEVSGSGETKVSEWQAMSREERQKRMEGLSPEERTNLRNTLRSRTAQSEVAAAPGLSATQAVK